MYHVAIVVLGDLGRSPRMQNHAYSCAALTEVSRVSLIGYTGERCIDSVEHNTKIHQKRFSVYELGFLEVIPFLRTIVKGVLVLVQLCVILGSLPTYDVILIQNPPALPAIFANVIVDWINPYYKAKTIIDWHNLGFSMFIDQYDTKKSISLKKERDIVKKLNRMTGQSLTVFCSRLLEHRASDCVTQHFCVSEAMKQWLITHFDIDPKQISVVYDRPPASFSQSISAQEKAALLKKLNFTYSDLFANGNEDCAEARVEFPEEFPIVISATSWTPDEDFEVLLTTLLDVDTRLARLNKKKSDPPGKHKLLVVVTGKGPTRAAFEAEVARHSREGRLQHIAIRTAWLEPADYPRLLRCASLGICLHTSTSGLDLPMKVLDMFGCALPVLAVDFPTIKELVKHEVNGLLFDERQPLQLSEYLMRLLYVGEDGSGNGSSSLSTLSAMRRSTDIGTWEDHWKQSAQPIIRDLLKQKSGAWIPKMLLFFSLSILLLIGIVDTIGPMYMETREEL